MHRHFTPQSGLVGGNVLDSFHRLNDIIETNDGVRNFNVETNNCFNVEAPFTTDHETRIRITNNHHDINQLSQSFLRMEFDADVSLSQPITGPYTLIPDLDQVIDQPKEAKLDPNPKTYDIESEIKTMELPTNKKVNDYFLIPTHANDQPINLKNYHNLLNKNTSILLLGVATEGSFSNYGWVIQRLCYYGFEYDYSDIGGAIKDNFTDGLNHFSYTETSFYTGDLAIHNIQELNPVDGQMLNSSGADITTSDDIEFIDEVCGPVWVGVEDKKYLFLVHWYNNPWDYKYKERLLERIEFQKFPIYEIDYEYWENLFDGKKTILKSNSAVLTGKAPTYDLPDIPIKSYDDSMGFESRSDPKLGIGIYWVHYLNRNLFIPITSDDGEADPTTANPKDDIKVLFDRLYREGFTDFIWHYETITITEFRKTQLSELPIVKIFLGWKNANEVIKQLQIENSNKDTKYSQRESTKEGFCYSTFMPNEQKKNNLFAHTSYENARSGFRGVCGGYIVVDPLNLDLDMIVRKEKFGEPYTLKQNFTVHNLEVILPIKDILCFEYFNDFPGALGDIVLKMYLNKDSMVFCQCDPKISYDQAYLKRFKNFAEAPSALDHCVYYREFRQVGQQTKLITDYSNYTSDLVSLSVTKLTCKKLSCECYGYNISPESKKQIVQLFSPDDPFLIPANQIDVVSFEKTMREMYQRNESQAQDPVKNPVWVTYYQLVEHYDSELSWPLRNVSGIVIVFPQNSLDYTTFMNPMLKNIQLRIQGRQYPQIPLPKTYGEQFFAHMIRASNQDSFIEADPDYVNSLLLPNYIAENNSITDVTSFLMTFQTERSSDNVFFDGIETGNENVNIQLEFYKTDDTPTSYMRYAPQLWLIRETYWTADIENGLRYWTKGTPEFETE